MCDCPGAHRLGTLGRGAGGAERGHSDTSCHGHYELELEAQLLLLEARRGQFDAANRRAARACGSSPSDSPTGWPRRARRTRPLARRPARRPGGGPPGIDRCDPDDLGPPTLGLGRSRSGIRAEADLAAWRGRGTPRPISPSPRALGAALVERMRAVFDDVDGPPALLHAHGRRLAGDVRSASSHVSMGRRTPIAGRRPRPPGRPSQVPISEATRSCARRKRRSRCIAIGRAPLAP